MTLEQPAGEMWQKIREELNENADTKDADLAHIKEWLKKEPHLPDEFGEALGVLWINEGKRLYRTFCYINHHG